METDSGAGPATVAEGGQWRGGWKHSRQAGHWESGLQRPPGRTAQGGGREERRAAALRVGGHLWGLRGQAVLSPPGEECPPVRAGAGGG